MYVDLSCSPLTLSSLRIPSDSVGVSRSIYGRGSSQILFYQILDDLGNFSPTHRSMAWVSSAKRTVAHCVPSGNVA